MTRPNYANNDRLEGAINSHRVYQSAWGRFRPEAAARRHPELPLYTQDSVDKYLKI